jgi:hypothetical protein
MLQSQLLHDKAARCLRRAEELRRDAETLKRFAEDLAAMAQKCERAPAGLGREPGSGALLQAVPAPA